MTVRAVDMVECVEVERVGEQGRQIGRERTQVSGLCSIRQATRDEERIDRNQSKSASPEKTNAEVAEAATACLAFQEDRCDQVSGKDEKEWNADPTPPKPSGIMKGEHRDRGERSQRIELRVVRERDRTRARGIFRQGDNRSIRCDGGRRVQNAHDRLKLSQAM